MCIQKVVIQNSSRTANSLKITEEKASTAVAASTSEHKPQLDAAKLQRRIKRQDERAADKQQRLPADLLPR